MADGVRRYLPVEKFVFETFFFFIKKIQHEKCAARIEDMKCTLIIMDEFVGKLKCYKDFNWIGVIESNDLIHSEDGNHCQIHLSGWY